MIKILNQQKHFCLQILVYKNWNFSLWIFIQNEHDKYELKL